LLLLPYSIYTYFKIFFFFCCGYYKNKKKKIVKRIVRKGGNWVLLWRLKSFLCKLLYFFFAYSIWLIFFFIGEKHEMKNQSIWRSSLWGWDVTKGPNWLRCECAILVDTKNVFGSTWTLTIVNHQVHEQTSRYRGISLLRKNRLCKLCFNIYFFSDKILKNMEVEIYSNLKKKLYLKTFFKKKTCFLSIFCKSIKIKVWLYFFLLFPFGRKLKIVWIIKKKTVDG
jgi:hypothetical protein